MNAYNPISCADLAKADAPPTGNMMSRAAEFVEEATSRVDATRGTYCPVYFKRNRAWLIKRESEWLSIRAVQADFRAWAKRAREARA